MTLEHREQGETREQILTLLRHRGDMTAAELSEALGIGAVGVRQHLALLDRDGLVRILEDRLKSDLGIRVTVELVPAGSLAAFTYGREGKARRLLDKRVAK